MKTSILKPGGVYNRIKILKSFVLFTKIQFFFLFFLHHTRSHALRKQLSYLSLIQCSTPLFSQRRFPRLDYQPLFGKMSPHSSPIFLRPTLNSILQTDVDTLMIGTQIRVRVRVRVIYLNQTGIRHSILGGVGITVMRSRSGAPSSHPTHSILNCFFPLKIEDTLTFMNISSRTFI